MPADVIEAKAKAKDYNFFLSCTDFLKMTDTLERYTQTLDLDTAQGREFYVFKRQLYKLYEIKHRSIDEHEAFSFNMERENLKWLWQANLNYQKEMARENQIEDMYNHRNLKGNIYKRRALDSAKLHGIGYFGFLAASYLHFPLLAGILGKNLAVFSMCASAMMGMRKLDDKGLINSIEYIRDGEHQGNLRINVSKGLFASSNIIVSPNNAQSLVQLDADGGEEFNMIQLGSYIDESGKE